MGKDVKVVRTEWWEGAQSLGPLEMEGRPVGGEAVLVPISPCRWVAQGFLLSVKMLLISKLVTRHIISAF